MAKKKKKSKIASLDLKNYKAKYADSYGLGAEKPTEAENFVEDEPPKEEPPVEPPIEKPIPKPVEPPSKIEPPPPEKPKTVEPPIEKTIPKPVEPPPKKERYEDIVRRVESNKRKMKMREPVKVNVRHEVKERPIGGFNQPANAGSEQEKTQHRSVESYGIAISAVALVYSFYVADKALFFLSMSLFTYLLRPLVGPLFGKHNQTVQNLLKGFSIAVFFGAILFIFY